MDKISKAELQQAASTDYEAEVNYREAEIRQGWAERVNYSALFSTKNLDNFKRELQPKAYDLIKSYNLQNGESIILYSPGIYRVGKTHLAYGLIDRYLKEYPVTYTNRWGETMPNPCPVYFTGENKLLNRIKDTYGDDKEVKETEEKIYLALRQYRMIIIDDLGKVQPSSLKHLQNVFYRIIDDRYNDCKSIMITMNMDLDEMTAYLGGASTRRLKDMCGANIIKMTDSKNDSL